MLHSDKLADPCQDESVAVPFCSKIHAAKKSVRDATASWDPCCRDDIVKKASIGSLTPSFLIWMVQVPKVVDVVDDVLMLMLLIVVASASSNPSKRNRLDAQPFVGMNFRSKLGLVLPN